MCSGGLVGVGFGSATPHTKIQTKSQTKPPTTITRPTHTRATKPPNERNKAWVIGKSSRALVQVVDGGCGVCSGGLVGVGCGPAKRVNASP